MMKIGSYTIKAEDEFNFGLYETKAKGSFRGKKAEGTKESLIGYYGYLDMAMSKIINTECLKALSGSSEQLVAEDIMNAINTVHAQLNDAYHKRPKGI